MERFTIVTKKCYEACQKDNFSLAFQLILAKIVVLQNTLCDLTIPQRRTTFGQTLFAFFRAGINLWNKLHYDVRLSSSIQSLKAKYKAHLCNDLVGSFVVAGLPSNPQA